jgi:hypothetical protein
VVIEGQTAEETVGERFILTTLDEEESKAIGGRMGVAKLSGMIRISGCNPKKANESFTQDGKKLISTLGSWTGNHIRSGRWNAYRSKNNEIYQFSNNEQNEAGERDVYTSHGSQLRLVEAMPLDRFNISDGTPIQIRSLANGSIIELLSRHLAKRAKGAKHSNAQA